MLSPNLCVFQGTLRPMKICACTVVLTRSSGAAVGQAAASSVSPVPALSLVRRFVHTVL
ncbi:hypothetical protein PF005_g19615 [Phytophthora fragariae]|uniref:Uncharacterized protein n=1 Tax=Phytophthora fragariae TaxID=53985 RepID=A0A6A3XVP0_9STRA|nr:hypothetical protein PF003_g9387 [Phytophthora fragariae]KAE8929304.1 hypothetical protein PF009_g20575 [Phytophthora fragariae]KAE8980546.1 hypothetical protein PF011_g22399 [Phytophthora fragariae]KAE9078907.1 hypothetical protein PF007_g23666 [Phytophthora fragariae]KAE9093657.1 hypothetical protein PF010_g17398 [Phytophthora fragariae]